MGRVDDTPPPTQRFGVFELDLRSGELRKSGVRIKVQEQPLKVLEALLQRPGEIITREELRVRIWPHESFGDFDHAVNIAVAKLRTALGDSADTPRFIETLHRRGYRFVAPVDRQVARGSVRRVAEAILPTVRRKLIVPALLAIVVLGAGGYFYLHRTPKLTEKDTLVLADFTNTTGDRVFDDALKTALNVSLRQSPFLNLSSEDRVGETLKLMARPASTPLTPAVTREVCQRVNGKAYIAGSISSLGSEYVLGLKAVNCRSGDTLAQEQVTAQAKEKVLDALGEAAAKLRGQLGESLATVQKFDAPLEQATTSSLEALKAYSLGFKALRQGALASLPYYERSIQLDPNFAMGYWAVGVAYVEQGEVGRAREYFAKAFQLREHASERERLTITADYYLYVTGELDKGARTYEEEIASYPQDSGAYDELGFTYAARGRYEEAVEEARKALRIAPVTAPAYDNFANDLLALQRFEEARQFIRQAEGIDRPALHAARYALGFLGGDSAAMVEQQQWFAEKGEFENFGLSLASDSEAYAGHLHKARELSKRAVDSAIHVDSRENGAIWQENAALREAAYGNVAEARQTAAQGLKLAPESQAVEVEAALAFAIAHDNAQAESLTQDLNKRLPLDTQVQSLWLPPIQAQLALSRKNPSEALTQLSEGGSIELGQILFVTNLSCLYSIYVRGQAYLALGQGAAAAAQFKRILDHSGIVWNCWTGALAHLGLARAYALQGDEPKARGAYQDFLTLWKDADPAIPILKQAKTEYAKLL